MNAKTLHRLLALAASALITLVLFQSVALLGLPPTGHAGLQAGAPAAAPVVAAGASRAGG